MAIAELTFNVDGKQVGYHSLTNTKATCNDCGPLKSLNEARKHTARTGHPTYFAEGRTGGFKLQESEDQPW